MHIWKPLGLPDSTMDKTHSMLLFESAKDCLSLSVIQGHELQTECFLRFGCKKIVEELKSNDRSSCIDGSHEIHEFVLDIVT